MIAPLPHNESKRLERLKDYNILDTLKERQFDEITKLASFVCDCPISLISFVNEKRQWFKSNRRLDIKETSRDVSFCAYSILHENILEIEDTLKDERFKGNRLVTDNPQIRFYAGAPLKTQDGYNLGSLCVIDTKPKKLTDKQLEALSILANRVMTEMNLKLELENRQIQEQKLQDVNRFQEQLISIIAHDLKSPMNSLLSTLTLFGNDDLSDSEIKEVLAALKTEAVNTNLLLENLLRWGKTKLLNFEISHDVFEIEEVINETLQLYAVEADKKEIKLKHIIEGNPTVCGDLEMVKTVLKNLLNNAVKFCPSGASVDFNVSEKDNKTIIMMEDTGAGMSSEKLENILNPSLTSQEDITKFNSSGLGSILISEFIKHHKGKIIGASQVDKGTTFRIELPSKCTDLE